MSKFEVGDILEVYYNEKRYATFIIYKKDEIRYYYKFIRNAHKNKIGTKFDYPISKLDDDVKAQLLDRSKLAKLLYFND